jgi:hypothetical protein
LRDGTGLGAQGEVGRIDFEDAVHLGEAEHDAAGQRHAAARQPRAAATGDHGRTVFAG